MQPVIDFRVRPPFGDFLQLPQFKRILEPEAAPRRTWFDALQTDSPSVRSRDMQVFLNEMDEAGVVLGVAMGRSTPAGGRVSNEVVSSLVRRYPGRFVPVGGADTSHVGDALQSARDCANRGFWGVCLENGWSSPPRYDDDDELMPLYEQMTNDGLALILTRNGNIGPSLCYSFPGAVATIAKRFPSLRIVVGHASWPWFVQMCAVAMICPNVYLLPDLFLNAKLPGWMDLVDATRHAIRGQVLFGSSYPVASLGSSVDAARALPLEIDVQGAFLFENAKAILGKKWTKHLDGVSDE